MHSGRGLTVGRGVARIPGACLAFLGQGLGSSGGRGSALQGAGLDSHRGGDRLSCGVGRGSALWRRVRTGGGDGAAAVSRRHGGVRSPLRRGPVAGMPAPPAAPGPGRGGSGRQRAGHGPRGRAHRGGRGGAGRGGGRPERGPLVAPALLAAGAAARAACGDLRFAARHRPAQPGPGLHQVPAHPAHRHHLEAALPGG